MSTQNKHGYESFVYHIRGYIKNLSIVKGTAIFNILPESLHRSDIDVGENKLPSITLIGRRLLKTDHGMKTEEKIFPVLCSAKFRCTNATCFPIKEGACHTFQIDEEEALRIRPFITNPDLVVNVKGIL